MGLKESPEYQAFCLIPLQAYDFGQRCHGC